MYTQAMRERMSTYDLFRGAEDLFARREFVTAADALEAVVDRLTREEAPIPLPVRELLARAYCHAARLERAEEEARRLLDEDPANDYAALLLSRVLQRRSRPGEAAGPLARHDALTNALG